MEVIIIGSGPAGINAAIYASQAGYKVTILAGSNPGGLLNTTEKVENYLGFQDISGKNLVKEFLSHGEKYSTIKNETVKIVKKDEKGFTIETHEGEIYKSNYVIVASGSNPKKIQILEPMDNYGVSYCAICDGFFYKGQNVMVVGGGNAAFEAVEYLSKICKKVYLVHRSDQFKSFDYMQQRVKNLENVKIITFAEVSGFSRDEDGLLKAIEIKEKDKIQNIEVSGVFVHIGHTPQSNFINFCEKDLLGYILVDRNQKTNIPGLSACGDCIAYRDGFEVMKQAIVAAAQGCIAALFLDKYN